MDQVWKYTFEQIGNNAHWMPACAEILDVQIQNGLITMWAKVNTENEKTLRSFCIVGTGHKFDGQGLKYIGTVQGGELVWHLFERL